MSESIASTHSGPVGLHSMHYISFIYLFIIYLFIPSLCQQKSTRSFLSNPSFRTYVMRVSFELSISEKNHEVLDVIRELKVHHVNVSDYLCNYIISGHKRLKEILAEEEAEKLK